MPDMLQPHFGLDWLRTVAAGFLATIVLLGASPAKASLLIRISHVVAEETPKGLAMIRFKALVEQRSAGQIRVVVYPAAQLYGDHDEIEALRLGAVDMLAPSLSKFGRIGFPEFELFDLPFLFDSVQSVRGITQGPIGQRLLERRVALLGTLDRRLDQLARVQCARSHQFGERGGVELVVLGQHRSHQSAEVISKEPGRR